MFWIVAVAVLVSGCGGRTEAANLEDTVRDLYDAPSEQQARFFLNYDRSAAFNTSVAFTIPLFSFTLPGAGDTSAAGMDLQSFGALAFIALFLLGGLAVAIYTTTQGGVSKRDLSDDASYQESLLTALVTESLAGIPNVIDARSCAQLAVCGAYSEPERYGLLAWPIKFLVSDDDTKPVDELSAYQKAARVGSRTEEDCQYEYPCLVQPLELLLYVYDYWYGEE
ncbi:uncharacterized protein LOC119583763 isoform X2 [Penaeus monodon]|nr:uncharacterized protein LOC119583763 isoform X2 [Penaeus monodon]XP_037788356.1 uncharacterized protein LOC119583763 isoform X2 [Penaeus monodon]